MFMGRAQWAKPKHDSTWKCWCDPMCMKLCPQCNGDKRGCEYCHYFPPFFSGLVIADDPKDVDMVIHRVA